MNQFKTLTPRQALIIRAALLRNGARALLPEPNDREKWRKLDRALATLRLILRDIAEQEMGHENG